MSPAPLCGPSGDPARGRDRVSNGFNLWKQRTDLSYRDVGSFDSFAQRAHVVTEYPAGTLLIEYLNRSKRRERRGGLFVCFC